MLAAVLVPVTACAETSLSITSREAVLMSEDGQIVYENNATEMGLVATNFENCTGLPAVSQFSCAKDVATMFANLIKHEHYFTCSQIWMEDFVHPSRTSYRND